MFEREAGRIDDCWNRIGIRGDQSCPRLREHIHCRNCPIYAAAATRLLDRAAFPQGAPDGGQAEDGRGGAGGAAGLPAWRDGMHRADLPKQRDQRHRGDQGDQRDQWDRQDQWNPRSPWDQPSADAGKASTLSILVFRLGAEWLALPTSTLAEVATMRPIHTLPRRSGVVTGVCNIRGRLLACISLPALLGLAAPAGASAPPGASAKALPRLLILNSAPRALATPVDEVEGIRAYSADALGPVPSTFGADRYTSAIARHGERTIGVLDGERLLHAIDRSLA
ncbi:chemotaxis protein CheW [Achromobacter aloeverae]